MQTYRDIDDVFAAAQRAIASKTTDKELAEYLNAFVQGRLTTGTPEAVPSYEAQRDRLVAVMKQLYANGFGHHQTLRGEIDGTPKFFEVILSMALVEHAVELVNVHYEKQEIAAGVSTVRKIPYAEFVIIDEKLKEQLATPDESATPTAATDIVATSSATNKREGRVIKNGREILIAVSGDRTYPIAQVSEDGSYSRFMDYVLRAENANIEIRVEDVNALKGTLQTVKDLTELIRRSGFTRKLKKAFFPTSKGKHIRFTPVALLDDEQFEDIKNQAKKVLEKNR